jgi:hypothetical protein
VTDRSSDRDAAERRFERRPRSVPPPRRPRDRAKAGPERSTEVAPGPEEETSSGSTEATSQTPIEAQSDAARQEPTEDGRAIPEGAAQTAISQEETPEPNEAQTQGEETDASHEQSRRSEGARDHTTGPPLTLSPVLQQEVAAALTPVMGEIQREIADAVRCQVQQSLMAQMSAQDAPAQQAPSSGQTVDQERGMGEAPPPQSGTRHMVTGFRQWVEQAVRAVIAKVKALLESVVRSLRTIARSLIEGLRSVVRGLESAVAAVWNGIKRLLFTVLEKVVLAVLRALLRSLLQRLMHWLQDTPGSPGTDTGSPGNSPEPAS